MRILVTGSKGFIGSNLVWQLNQMGRKDILIVDNLENTVKFKNMLGFFFLSMSHTFSAS